MQQILNPRINFYLKIATAIPEKILLTHILIASKLPLYQERQRYLTSHNLLLYYIEGQFSSGIPPIC
jgi:hypothetical protein